MPFDIERLKRTRHLSVPDFGPYSMVYAGVTHLARKEGASVDWMFAFRRDGEDVLLPSHLAKGTRFHAYGADQGLRHFRYKFDLLGLEDVVAIADCFPTDNDCRIRIALRNQTDSDCTVDFEMAGVVPALLRPAPVVQLRDDEQWMGAESYDDCHTWRMCMEDGYRNMVARKPGAIDGVALSRRWSGMAGTTFDYAVDLEHPLTDAKLGVRYSQKGRNPMAYVLVFGGCEYALRFPAGEGYQTEWLALGDLDAGRHIFTVKVQNVDTRSENRDLYGNYGSDVLLDGFILGASEREDYCTIPETDAASSGQRKELSSHRFLAHSGDGRVYGWRVAAPAEARVSMLENSTLYHGDNLEAGLAGAREVGTLAVGGIRVPAKGEVEVALVVAAGDTDAAVTTSLDETSFDWPEPKEVTEGIPERFRFGYRLLASNVLMNISYPVFTPWETIATYTPGKCWGGLYSWDAGMHGLGLLEVDMRAAVEVLNVYLCGDDVEPDFIWHGTPLPVQAFLLNEIWLRTRDRELLAFYYPRIRRFYEHLIGRASNSKTNRFKTDLVNTYPIFYNTGGWDDLPPQAAVHQKQTQDQISPVISTAHVIRFARFMKRFARELASQDATCGDDLQRYEDDIQRSITAVEKTWDDTEGIYSYVHHATFEPFRHEESGRNYNHTLDGLTPLVSGGTDPNRARVLLKRLGMPGRYFTGVGLSTVDQAAPYYKEDGYWNGSVWIPHQWFMFKAALDHGEGALALRIAHTVSEVWEREARRRHCSFELFKIATGLGGGYVHFAGLSSPALGIIAGISRPGTLSIGYNTEWRDLAFMGDDAVVEMRTDSVSSAGAPYGMLVMAKPGTYRVRYGDHEELAETTDLGTLVFRVPQSEDWTRVTMDRVGH